MDAFTREDFRGRVYNDVYRLIDPDFESKRPATFAAHLLELLGEVPIRVCDYGGGSGTLARHVNSAGRALRAVTWDPFFDTQPRPSGRFELVVSFEAFEHAIDPSATLADMLSLTDENHLVLMSTLCQPAEIDALRTDWWYCAPRNGHVSLHTRQSLDRLADDAGIGLVHMSDHMHLFHDALPPWIESAIFGSR
ncbi:MAG: class I SAM-dependent methyltransferase [Burkholderiales bacterium]